LCVEGSGGLVLVLEVDVDVAVAGERDDASGEGVELCGCIAAAAAEAEAGVGGGGVDLGGKEILAFGDAEGGVVLAECGVDLVGEPGLVAELEGDGRGVRGGEGGRAEEFAEAVGVGGEVGRKLEEEAAEFAGLADGLDPGNELLDVGGAVAETAEVGDALGGLKAETEAAWRGGDPDLEHGGGGEGAEGVVDLDRRELGGVEAEEAFGGCARGVEAGLPRGVGPAGGSGKEAGWGGACDGHGERCR